jgi:glycosyltransferase involved in cell wall biosynthesis
MILDYSLVAPIPPQKSGIADYADGLIFGLKSLGRTVQVYTQTRFSPVGMPGIRPLSEFNTDVSPPERTVYQVGNNSVFHDEQILHLMKTGGIAHLHDFSLHHIFAHSTYSGDKNIHYGLLQKSYGAVFSESVRARHEAHCVPFWETQDVVFNPLHEEVVSRACAVIVHSQFAKRFIAGRFSHKSVYVVPQRYPDAVATRRIVNRPLKVCSLGFVDPHKTVDKIVEAVARCRDRGVDILLDVAGEIHPRCENLPLLAENLDVADRVNFLGAVSQGQLFDFFKASDVCVVLRDPTVGETSAIVSRALQYGVPLIVNDVGSYSELPAFVPKLSTGRLVSQELSDILCRWATDLETFRLVSDEAYRYACEKASFPNAIVGYDRILQEIQGQTPR